MSASTYGELSDSELRTEAARIERELNRRRIHSIADAPASIEGSDTELEYVDDLWADAYMGGLRETEDGEQVIGWLWSGIVIAHESQYERLPSVKHVAEAICEHLGELLLQGGGEDTTDMRDLNDPPSFGGHGCTCTLSDTGGPEYGPRLSVDIDERCPLHSHLLREFEDECGMTQAEFEAAQAEYEASKRAELDEGEATRGYDEGN